MLITFWGLGLRMSEHFSILSSLQIATGLPLPPLFAIVFVIVPVSDMTKLLSSNELDDNLHNSSWR